MGRKIGVFLHNARSSKRFSCRRPAHPMRTVANRTAVISAYKFLMIGVGYRNLLL